MPGAEARRPNAANIGVIVGSMVSISRHDRQSPADVGSYQPAETLTHHVALLRHGSAPAFALAGFDRTI